MFVYSPYKHGLTLRLGIGVGLGIMLLFVMPLIAFAGIYDADTPTTYKEYWIDHSEYVVTATVERIEYTVQIGLLGGQNGLGGTVSMAPATGPFYYGDRLTFTATPNAGYRFVHWSIDTGQNNINAALDNGFDPTEPQIEVAVTSSATYLAEFSLIGTTDAQIFLPIVVGQ